MYRLSIHRNKNSECAFFKALQDSRASDVKKLAMFVARKPVSWIWFGRRIILLPGFGSMVNLGKNRL